VLRFEWILYVFGAFLLFTGVKMAFSSEDGVHPEKNPIIRLVRRVFPVTRYSMDRSSSRALAAAWR